MDTNVNLEFFRVRISLPRQVPFYVIGVARDGSAFLDRVKKEFGIEHDIYDCLEILRGGNFAQQSLGLLFYLLTHIVNVSVK